jgi:transcription initiation factor IIF auxiliary subunit
MSYLIKSNVIRSVEGKVKYKQLNENGKKHFHLGVWIEAPERELDEVEFVEYSLHPTFKKQKRVSRNRPNNFSITFWTWGMFNIDVTIHLHSGEIINKNYYLEYDLPNNKEEYAQV